MDTIMNLVHHSQYLMYIVIQTLLCSSCALMATHAIPDTLIVKLTNIMTYGIVYVLLTTVMTCIAIRVRTLHKCVQADSYVLRTSFNVPGAKKIVWNWNIANALNIITTTTTVITESCRFEGFDYGSKSQMRPLKLNWRMYLTITLTFRTYWEGKKVLCKNPKSYIDCNFSVVQYFLFLRHRLNNYVRSTFCYRLISISLLRFCNIFLRIFFPRFERWKRNIFFFCHMNEVGNLELDLGLFWYFLLISSIKTLTNFRLQLA